MNRGSKEIREILENPKLITKLSLEQIDIWIKETPYVQYLHLLKAVKLKSLKVKEKEAYHMAATMVNDRIQMNELLSLFDETKPKRKKKKTKKKKKARGSIHNRDKQVEEMNKVGDEDVNTEKSSSDIESDSLKTEEPIVTQGSNKETLELEEIEESIEEWNPHSVITVMNNRNAGEMQSEDESLSNEFHFSDFTQWLIAFDSPEDTVNQKRVDDSVDIEGALINENYAQILAAQGHHQKAIDMYEKLSLTNPEKSTYFAALIEKLKKQ